ncbi:SDR family oxidoreductase [Micromonospora sp. NPDC047074]|uniref:SDR family NAD(P)-dependent oxidoreductase n=1 Tax=Micromonospora sp. NPDC047074 TaxID=3154339 RepID=UPI0033C779F5
MDFAFPAGETVVVTGAGSGIGRATALLAAAAGLRVAAWDVAARAVAGTADEIVAGGGAAVALTVDVADSAAVRAALAASGPARYLVNNAGPASSADLDFDRALALTVGSVRTVTDAWLAGRTGAGAAVVNVASVAGNLVGTDSAWYCAGKAAIAGYTRHLATRRAPAVRANAVAPGLIETPRTAGFAATDLGRDLVARNPMGRAGQPAEVAHAVLFLLSPLAGYLNGVLLPVDGGWTVTQ